MIEMITRLLTTIHVGRMKGVMASSEPMAQLRLQLRLKRDVGMRLEFVFRNV